MVNAKTVIPVKLENVNEYILLASIDDAKLSKRRGWHIFQLETVCFTSYVYEHCDNGQ